MADKTSEAELTLLERSKDQPIKLLDHAAQIAGVRFDEQTKSYRTKNAPRSDAATDFRQQWLLKWLLKKFNEALLSSNKGDKHVPTSSIFLHQKSWAFFAYLFRHISNQSLLDILLERNFSRIFCESVCVVLKEHVTGSDKNGTAATITYSAEGTDERPQKRRRLSDENGEHKSGGVVQSTKSQPGLDLLVSLLEVASEFANALQHASSYSEAATRKAIPSWASSTMEAATLIGRVVEIANVLLRNSQTIQKLEFAFQSVTSCLGLWQDYSSADSALDKQLVHTQFNGACLVSCLDLLHSMREQQSLVTARSAQVVIERQIALHTLLPVRTTFVDSCSSSWKAEQTVISWVNIEQPYTQITTHLKGALEIETIAGDVFVSLKKAEHASSLLEIASRLVPKDDIRRRQWERPWFEALTLVLYHLAFSKDIPKLQKNQKGDLEPTGTVLPPSPQDSVLWPTVFLDTVRHQCLNLSTPTLTYLATSTLLWRGQSLPVSVLSQLLELDVNCFIPQPDAPTYQTCLDRLMTMLEEFDELRSQDVAQVTRTVIIPLMRGFSRSRDLRSFVKLWIPHLEDALRARTTPDVVSDSVDCSLTWDQEDLFNEFETICTMDVPQGLAKELLIEVSDKMRSIARTIGSTADTFAKAAILISLLKTRSLEPISSSSIVQSLADLAETTCNALVQNNDYQSQRWRLWSLVRTLQSLGSFNLVERDLYTLLQTPIAGAFAQIPLDPSEPTEGESVNRLFEAFQCFLFLTECSVTKSDRQVQACAIVTKQVSDQLENSLKKYVAGDRLHQVSWNGSIDSLNSADHLLCGYLAALSRKPKFAQIAVTKDLNLLLRRVALKNTFDSSHNISEQGSLGQLAQILLITLDEVMSNSAFQSFAEVLLGSNYCSTPAIMHSLPVDGVDKSCVADLAEKKYQEVLTAFTTAKEESQKHASAPLALLTRLVMCSPVSVGLPDHFLKLSQLAEAANTKNSSKDARSITSSLIKIISVFQDRALKLENEEKKAKLTSQMKVYLDGIPTAHQLIEGQASDIKNLLRRVVASLLEGERYELSGSSLAHLLRRSEVISIDQLEESGVSSQLATTEMVDNSISVNIQSMQNQTQKSKMSMLEKLKCSSSERSDVASYLKIAALVNSFSMEDIQSNPEAAQTLNAMVTLENTVDATDILQLVFKLETSALIMKIHPSIVNQASIDTLLQSLTSLASSASKISKPEFDTSKATETNQIQPSAIYDRLLTLLGILLTRHRRRLSGRTHLLLPLLQNLLKCLFYTPSRVYIHQNPSTTKQKQAFRSSLPSWLQIGLNQPLPASSAEKLSRILSSICNPTTASARSAHRTHRSAPHLDLNDETRKAKRIAAQYMQYLIMEFARCTLDGVIVSETRDKLIPGLYVVLDALDRDLMRAMNAAMDPSSRAIFKGLYDEWIRFGKWDQN